MLRILSTPFRFVQYWFWTAVLKLAYYIGKLDSDSPGQTNLRLSLDLNYYALGRLWKMENYKVGWLFRMVESRRILRMNKERARAEERNF